MASGNLRNQNVDTQGFPKKRYLLEVT